MKHQMRIVVSRPNEKPISITEFKKLTLLERLQSRWFGRVQRLMVIVPQDSVKSIEIKEVRDEYDLKHANQSNPVQASN